MPPEAGAPSAGAAARIAHALMERRWLLLVLGLLLTAICVAGLTRLDIRHDYRLFIDLDDPELQIADRLRDRTAGGREQLALIYIPESGRLFESTSMLQLAKLADRASRFPHVEQPQSLMTAQKLVHVSDAPEGASPRDSWAVVPFIHPDGLFDDAGLRRMAADAAALPGIGGRLVARDQSSALVLLAADLGDESHAREARMDEILAKVEIVREDLQGLRPGDRVELVGAAMFDRSLADILVDDAIRLAPVALGLYFLLLFLLFRSVPQALLVLMIVVAASASALGIIAWMGVTTTVLAFSGLLLVATLAVAEALHLVSGYTSAQLDGHPPLDAMRHSLDHNFWPILVTSLTTAVGEAVLLFSTSPAVQDMGLVMIVGAILAFIFTLSFLPALLPLTKSSRRSGFGWMQPMFEGVADQSARRPHAVLAITAFLCLLILPGMGVMSLHDSMPGWFSERTSFRQGLDRLDSGYGAVSQFTVASPVDTALRNAGSAWNGDSDDRGLRAEAALDGIIAQTPGVARVTGPSSARAALEARLASAPPEETSLTLPSALVQEAVTSGRPSPAMLESAGLATPTEAGRRDHLLRLVEMREKDNAAILSTVTGVRKAVADSGREAEAGGLPVVFASLGDRNLRATVGGTLITAIGITLCLMIAFRSWRLGLLSLLPNLLPVFLIFGAWGWFSGTMNLAATTVLAVALGIVVDDTTHIFLRHDRLVRQGVPPVEASRRTVSEVGPAITVTSLVLAAGFFLLGQSDFALTAQQANMIGAAILAAVLFDLTATPAMLAIADRRKTTSAAEDAGA